MIPEKYPLQETPSASYPPRTEQNVEESDGTVIFDAGGKPSRGTQLTIRCCAVVGKSFLVLRGFPDVAVDAAKLTAFLTEKKLGVLKVAGNRERGTSGVHARVLAVLTRVLARGDSA